MRLWPKPSAGNQKLAKYPVVPLGLAHDVRHKILEKLEARITVKNPARANPGADAPKRPPPSTD